MQVCIIWQDIRMVVIYPNPLGCCSTGRRRPRRCSVKIDIHASCFFMNFQYIHRAIKCPAGPTSASKRWKSAGMRFGRAAALDISGCRRSSDGLASSHQPEIFGEAVQPGRDGTDGGGKEAIFQRARWDLLYVVGHCRVVVMVLMRAQLGAEQVLVRKCAATPSSSSHSQSEADRAPELVRMVVHAGANGLEIGDLGSVALLLLFSSLSTPLQRVLLDVDDHATAVPRQGSPLLCIPSLVLAVHGQETKDHQVKKGPNNRQPH